jgi:hypothetical protein
MAGGRRWTEAEENALREMASMGDAAIAEALGRSLSSVCSRASALGVRLGRCDPSRLITSPEQFMERVEFDPFGGCWLWARHKSQSEYGATMIRGKHVLAHRLSWEIHRGPIPGGMFVCHKCDVRMCVNPDHLFLGTHAENMADMIAKGRRRTVAKITEADARRVLSLLRSGVGPTEAARRVGVTASTARNIAYGNSWKHIGQAPPPTQKLKSRNTFRKRWGSG